MNNTNNIFEIKNICKNYKDFSVKNVSFSLPKGYIMGFIGRNGAGKTTTIRSMLNMARPDSGEINIFGMDSVKNSVEIKKRIGVVFDDLCLPSHLNIEDIEHLLKNFYPLWSSSEFFRRTESFSLPRNKKIKSFSKGMKMKLMIAAALSHQAELLILDEPASGLDPVARSELMDIISEFISDEDHSVLFSTHIISDVERFADYITILHNGQVWSTGEKDTVLERYIILKGGNNELSDGIRKNSLGIKESRLGFEALWDTENEFNLPADMEFDKPTLEDILVFIERNDELCSVK